MFDYIYIENDIFSKINNKKFYNDFVKNNYNLLFLYINKIIFYISGLIYIIIYINLLFVNKNLESVWILATAMAPQTLQTSTKVLVGTDFQVQFAHKAALQPETV